MIDILIDSRNFIKVLEILINELRKNPGHITYPLPAKLTTNFLHPRPYPFYVDDYEEYKLEDSKLIVVNDFLSCIEYV